MKLKPRLDLTWTWVNLNLSWLEIDLTYINLTWKNLYLETVSIDIVQVFELNIFYLRKCMKRISNEVGRFTFKDFHTTDRFWIELKALPLFHRSRLYCVFIWKCPATISLDGSLNGRWSPTADRWGHILERMPVIICMRWRKCPQRSAIGDQRPFNENVAGHFQINTQ